MTFMFDEDKLGEEIARVWGEHGAHSEVYGMLRDHLAKTKAINLELLEALKAASNTFPELLGHPLLGKLVFDAIAKAEGR